MRILVILSIVVLAGCTETAPPADDVETGPEAPTGDVLLGEAFHNATGTLTSVPMAAEVNSGGFEVLPNTARMEATLLWSDAVAELALELTAQNATDGHSGGTFTPSEDGRIEAELPEPALGAWTYTVSGENAVNVDWTLIIRFATDSNVSRVLSETVTIAAGQFFEINTEMPLDGRMDWDWTSDATTDFNVHTHFDDEVQYLVEESGTSHKGHIIADREGGYSLMWENPGAAPVSLTYTAWGQFEVDSYFPPR